MINESISIPEVISTVPSMHLITDFTLGLSGSIMHPAEHSYAHDSFLKNVPGFHLTSSEY